MWTALANGCRFVIEVSPAEGTIAAVEIHGTSACSAGSSATRLRQFLRRVEAAMSQFGPTRTFCGIIAYVGCLRTSGPVALIASYSESDPTRTSSLSQQHGCEGIIGLAFVLRRWRAQFRRPMNSMISRVRPNCRSRDSRWARGKCNAADRKHCEGEKSASRFDGHFDPP